MRRFPVILLLITLTTTSCLSEGSDASRFVPEDAYAALVAESPQALLQSAEGFVKAAGLDRFLDGKSVLDKLRDLSAREEGLQEAVKNLDFGKSFAITAIPDRTGPEPKALMVIWLPLKSGATSYAALLKTMKDYDGSSAYVDGYAALCPNGTAPVALPSSTADLTRLSGYPADSLKAWINIEALRTDFREGWGTALKDAFQSTQNAGDDLLLSDQGSDELVDPEEPYNFNERNFDWDEYYGESEDSSLLSSGILGGALDAAGFLAKAAENLKALDFAVGADGRGFYLRAGATVNPDRALGKLTAAAGPAKGVPFLKYLEADALIGAAASFDPRALAGFADLYVKALGLEKLLGEEYFDLLKSVYGSVGADSAFSFDMAVDPDFMEKVGRAQSPEEISDVLRRSIAFEASGAGTLRDRQLYRSALKKLEGEGLFGDAFRELLDSTGLSLGFTVAQAAVEGIPYDSIRVNLGGEGLGSEPSVKVMLNVVLDKLTTYTGYDKDKYYLVMGDSAKLPAAVRRDGASKPITADKAYSTFASTLPKTTRGVYYLSLRRLLELASPLIKDKSKLPSGELDRLYGYFAADTKSLETGFFLGSGDIRALVGLVPRD